MSGARPERPALSPAERLRRARRDLEAYRRRSLLRRVQGGARFRRYLEVVPHVFLAPGRAVAAPLLVPAGEARARLRGDVVWTLDTATRLRYGIGLLAAEDLTGYLGEDALARAVAASVVGRPSAAGLSVDPPYAREPLLVAHVLDEAPPAETLASGERVVTRERLIRDIFGTLGFRPDLLARIEAAAEG